jgi:hypothetical protein
MIALPDWLVIATPVVGAAGAIGSEDGAATTRR